MASRVLLILLSCTCLSMLAYAAAPPTSIALNQAFEPSETLRMNASKEQNISLSGDSITFQIPGTKFSLIFSKLSALISQAELDLCIVEGISSIFGTVLAKGKDGFLPLNALEYKYGNVVINVYDFMAPTFQMTYASVVSTLRGIALFTSLYGYYSASIEVYDSKTGHVGSGDFGPIVPAPPR